MSFFFNFFFLAERECVHRKTEYDTCSGKRCRNVYYKPCYDCGGREGFKRCPC